jgi:nicotinate phosphoribosyltransferase
MAHSFVLSFSREEEAFRAYSGTFPERSVLLVDTFDTLAAVERAAGDGELRFVAIRLDSGNIVELSRASREILDRGGRREVRIVASGDLDESRIAEIVAAGSPIDSFGVGTRMVTSADAPTLQGVYKLVAVEEPGRAARGVAKKSAGKRTAPGTKQVWRRRASDGTMVEDLVTPVADRPAQGPWEPLLEPWMSGGRLCRQLPTLEENRSYARRQVAGLPEPLRGLGAAPPFPVTMAPSLQAARKDDAESVHPRR